MPPCSAASRTVVCVRIPALALLRVLLHRMCAMTNQALSTATTFKPDVALTWYRRNRTRSRALFDLLTDDAYYSRPIALRHPIVFYEGHLPAFSFNTLVKRGLGCSPIDERLETLFARGIDPSP